MSEATENDETVHVIYPVEKSSISSDRLKESALLKEILSAVCALLNSNGGKVVLHIDIIGHTPSIQKMSVIRKLEQSMISIIGTQLTTSNINFKEDKESIVIYVLKADYLITTNYNLYLPSQTQVVQVSPLEPLEKIRDDIIKRKKIDAEAVQHGSHSKIFPKDKRCGFSEGKNVELKHVNADPKKRTKLADRMTGRGNKFSCYVSAFANYRGGHIYYGINDDGIVEGEFVSSEEEKHGITKKVEKTIDKIIWPELVRPPERRVQWDIFFEPVLDQNFRHIPSTFVIVVYIAACLGGVFTEEPECYEMVEGKVKKMPFPTWKRRMLQPIELFHSRGIHSMPQRITWGSTKIQRICVHVNQLLIQSVNNGKSIEHVSENLERVLQHGNMEDIPFTVHRIAWSSPLTERHCSDVDEILMGAINDAKWQVFEHLAKFYKEKYPECVEIQLVVLSKRVITCCRRNCFEAANALLSKYTTTMRCGKDLLIFEAIYLYLKIALARAEQNQDLTESMIADGLSKTDIIPPGKVSASLLVLLATSSGKGKEQQRNGVCPQGSQEFRQRLCEKALEHLENVVEPSAIATDLKRKAHINLASQHLAYSSSQNLDKIKDHSEVNLNLAQSSIVAVEQSIQKEGPLALYRQIQFDNVQSYLHYRRSQVPNYPNDHNDPNDNDQSLSEYQLIEKALECVRRAKRQAIDCQFHEMVEWTAASEVLYAKVKELVRAQKQLN